MAVPKQNSIRRIQQQRDFCNKKREKIEQKEISPEEHEERLKKLKELGLIK